MIRIGHKREGITIQYQTRGLSTEESQMLYKRLSFDTIIKSCEETGQCLVTYADGLVAEIKKTKVGYVIAFGKEMKIDG